MIDDKRFKLHHTDKAQRLFHCSGDVGAVILDFLSNEGASWPTKHSLTDAVPAVFMLHKYSNVTKACANAK